MVMVKQTLKFEANLGNSELDALLEELSVALSKRLPLLDSVEFVKHSDSAFDAVLTVEEASVVDKQAVNVSLAEVGLSGFII